MSNAHDWEQCNVVKRIGSVMQKAGPIQRVTTAAPAGAPYRKYTTNVSASKNSKKGGY